MLDGFKSLAADEIKHSDCRACHSDKTLLKTNATGNGVYLFVGQSKRRASVHKTSTCASCRADITSAHQDEEVAA